MSSLPPPLEREARRDFSRASVNEYWIVAVPVDILHVIGYASGETPEVIDGETTGILDSSDELHLPR